MSNDFMTSVVLFAFLIRANPCQSVVAFFPLARG
jgi:hypothetical protein